MNAARQKASKAVDERRRLDKSRSGMQCSRDARTRDCSADAGRGWWLRRAEKAVFERLSASSRRTPAPCRAPFTHSGWLGQRARRRTCEGGVWRASKRFGRQRRNDRRRASTQVGSASARATRLSMSNLAFAFEHEFRSFFLSLIRLGDEHILGSCNLRDRDDPGEVEAEHSRRVRIVRSVARIPSAAECSDQLSEREHL